MCSNNFSKHGLDDSTTNAAVASSHLGLSMVIAAYMMVQSLRAKGYDAHAIAVPSRVELFQIIQLAAPVFFTTVSKVSFYSLMIYFATSTDTHTVVHQPLSQTAQTFMPELLNGVDQKLDKAQMLLKSLLIIGAMLGLGLGVAGTSVSWLLPKFFTSDDMVIQKMHKVLIPFFFALAITPCTHSLEGTLLAGRELKLLSLSMSGCFSLGAFILLVR